MSTSKWNTFAEAVAAVHGGNPHLATVLGVTKTRPCPPPAWDADGVYQVTLAGDTPVIQKLAADNTWIKAPLQPPAERMSETQKKLEALRDRLEQIESWPWSGIEAWIASATPLIKRAFPDCYDEFVKVTATPRWLALPRFISGGSRWDDTPPTDNFASAAASEDEANRGKAERAKANILGFLQGLLELPPAEPVARAAPHVPSGHTIHAQGDVNLGPSNRTSFTNSPVAAAATAPGAIAMAESSTQSLRAAVADVQAALVSSQDALDDIHELLHDALAQLLRSVRKIEFEHADQARVIAQIKASVDDIWVKHELAGVKLPASLEVTKAILGSPLLGHALKGILEGS